MTQPTTHQNFDAVVVGAGAAGLMCAIEAGKRGRRVLLLEHADRVGKKILISGGGRSNFTNLHTRPDNFLSANPHFAKSALARYTPADFIALVESYGIRYHEKTLGQLFCDDSAKQIVAMLLAEAAQANVKIILEAKVQEIRLNTEPDLQPGNDQPRFRVTTNTATYTTANVVIATGGLSIPKMGATSFGYDIARQFNIPICDPRPALVPLVLGDPEHNPFADLTGVSAEVIASLGKHRFREKLLFTHRGLSGPAILQISSYWTSAVADPNPKPIQIDWAPNHDLLAPLREPNARRDSAVAKAALRTKLPARLAERLLEAALPPNWTNHALDQLERQLHAWPFTPTGTEGYEKAEVTAGGVDTDALSAQTMECRAVPGLYFIGEVVDVTGHLGGFNFQWAWASGAAAGRAI